ncbi:hypothetical protein D9M70_517800 [compost metagenome]
MRNGSQNLGDLERLESGAVIDPIHFQTNISKLLDDLSKRRIGFKVILEPGKREFHLFIPYPIFTRSDRRTASECRVDGNRND